MFHLTEKYLKSAPMRDSLGNKLVEMAETDERIAVLDADLIGASGLKVFQNAYPERTFDCGIQEANMLGVAAGMSESGIIPFVHSFACFVSRKCIDQIFLSACYGKMNVKIIGTDGALCSATNGGSHQGMEDMGILNSFPNITLIDMTDSVMLEALLPVIKDTYGVYYFRIHRRAEELIYEPGSDFRIGKGNILVEGTDATIIASGIEVKEALEAAKLLQKKGISVRIVDMFTWRPLDRKLIVESAEKTGAIVTAENHCLATGLGHAVSAVVVEECPVPMGFIGVNEQFGEVGDLAYLKQRFHMTAGDIANKVEMTIRKKR